MSRAFTWSWATRARIVAAAAIAAIAFPAAAHAAAFTVRNNFDSGAGSLRDAIDQANASSDASSTITFAAALAGKTISLDTELPAIDRTLTITGPNHSSSGITIDGDFRTQVMLVNPPANLTLTYVTIADGVVDRDFDGGGIENDGTLTLNNCTLRLNRAGFGGAIANFGVLTVSASTFQDNFARMGGDFFGGRPLVITNSTFTGSSAEGTGGSILNGGGAVTVTNSTFVRIAAGGFGGAIGNLQGTVKLKGTLLADSASGNCAAPDQNVITDEGYNLSDDGTCKFTQSTSANNASMLDLDPRGLSNNGGPTETIALLAGSVAIDKIPLADCTDLATGDPVTTDQRGEPRPDPEDGPNGKCDIGAYEYQAPPKPLIDCGRAAASAPNLVALPAVFFPETITGVVDSGGSFSISIARVLQSKPVLKFPRCPDARIAGSVAFVRATNQSRARTGSMLYGIGFTATDRASGASCSGAVPVCVQDLRHRGEPCIGTATFDATRCK